jgi:tetratricopeptide (TPR) repeat protein
VVSRLDGQFDLLASGLRDLPARQQTLWTTIAWSYDLLSFEEQTLFRRLAVFLGGFTGGAVETISGGSDADGKVQSGLRTSVIAGLESLVRKSLVIFEPGQAGAPRYRMLETIRAFAAESLAANGIEQSTRDAHAGYFLSLAEAAEPRLKGPEQATWIARLNTERDNIGGALTWSLDRGNSEMALRFVAALWRYWQMQGYWNEGRRLAEHVVANDAGAGTAVRGRALYGAGALAWSQGDFRQARQRFEEALEIAQAQMDRGAEATALNGLGVIARVRGDMQAAAALQQHVLAIRRELGDRAGIASTLSNLAVVQLTMGEPDAAIELLEESVAIDRELGNAAGIAGTLTNLANALHDRGDLDRARSMREEVLAIRRQLGDKTGIANSLHNLALEAHERGDLDRAQEMHEEALAIQREAGEATGIASSLNNLALLNHERGDDARAVPLLQESLRVSRDNDLGLRTIFDLEAAAILIASKAPADAARLFGAASGLRTALGVPPNATIGRRNDRFAEELVGVMGETCYGAARLDGESLPASDAIAEAIDLLASLAS